MKWVRMMAGGVVYFSAASFLAIALAGSVLWAKGAFSGPRAFNLLAALYGLDLAEMQVQGKEVQPDESQIQIAYLNVLADRTRASLDIDLRESAIDKTLGELHNLQNNVVIQRERDQQVVGSFERRLKDYQTLNDDARLREVQVMLENMKSKQAKDSLMAMVADNADDTRDVVLLLTSMASDKQKKVIAEFKTPEEKATMDRLLAEIRRGTAENELLDDARKGLGGVGKSAP